MAKEYKLSPQRLKELQEEMNYLKTVREKEVAELIKEARSFGDLSEISEYDEGTMYAWAPPSRFWTRSSTRRRPIRS